MSLHINRFIDRIKASESRGQKDFVMTINEARDLHADITKLLIALQSLHEQSQTSSQEITQVEMQGGSF